MSQTPQPAPKTPVPGKALVRVDVGKVIEAVILRGDLTDLKAEERVAYYRRFCQHLDLDPVTQPFDFLQERGRLKLYANRSCAEQLRVKRRVSVVEETKEFTQGLCMVTVKVMDAEGRTDAGTGAVPVEGLKGADLANAIMKAETKAKRRATLSICGLGLMDETEVSDLTGGMWMDRLREEKATWEPEPWKEIVTSALSDGRVAQIKDFKDFTKDEAQDILAKARARRAAESKKPDAKPLKAPAPANEVCPKCGETVIFEANGEDRLPIHPDTGEIHKCPTLGEEPDPNQRPLFGGDGDTGE